ncbi:MAG: hypothetical protein IJR70_03360 [Eubacterium sp.]|nr:hypothetical protein [Eubacterium sp.]
MKRKELIFLFIFIPIISFGFILHYTFADVTYHSDKAASQFWYYADRWILGSDDYDSKNYKSKMNEMLSELGFYDNYELNTRKRHILFFESRGMTLIGNYNKNNYLKQKEYIEKNYDFATKDNDSQFKYELDEKSAFEFDLENWHFRILIDSENTFIPEYFRMVGFNGKENRIAFLSYADQDQDCFGDNNDEADMRKFVKESFRLK